MILEIGFCFDAYMDLSFIDKLLKYKPLIWLFW